MSIARGIDPEEQRRFAEAVALFVADGTRTVDGLQAAVQAVRAGSAPADAIRRTVHTLKAEFGVLELTAAQSLCHHAESAIDACTAAGLPFPADAMLDVAAELRTHFDRLARGERPAAGGAEALLARLAAIVRGAAREQGDGVQLVVGGEFAGNLPEFVAETRVHLAAAEAGVVALLDGGGGVQQAGAAMRAFRTIRGFAGLLNVTPLAELAHAAETRLIGERAAVEREHLQLVLSAIDTMRRMLAALQGGAGPSRRACDRLLAELRPTSRREPARAAPPPAPAPSPARARPHSAAPVVLTPSPTVRSPRVASHASVRVGVERLDAMAELASELFVAYAAIEHAPALRAVVDRELAREVGRVGRLVRELQECSVTLRVVTIDTAFATLARLAHDLAGKTGKRVTLGIEGEATELDVEIAEALAAPLLHLVRNALDHGIEAPDERATAGKPATGRVSLAARRRGASVEIEVRDDGRGLDRDRIVAKAIERGFVTAAQAAALTEADAFALIFRAGLSTAPEVTEVSGRGMGMDIVLRAVEGMRGTIRVESQRGVGTAFILRVPVGAVVVEGVVVRVGANRYVVRAIDVEHAFRPAAHDVHRPADRGECVQVRGALLPVHRLKDVFAVVSGGERLDEGMLIVTDAGGERCCLFVDEVLEPQRIVARPLGLSCDHAVGIAGGTILADGGIALVVDVAAVVEFATNAAAGVHSR